MTKIEALYTFSVKTTNFHVLTVVAKEVLLLTFCTNSATSRNKQKLATVGK